MIAIKSSPPAVAPAPLNMHARLEAATEALLKTRDQVIEALDRHLNELDTLRRSLATAEKPQVAPATMAPAAGAVMQLVELASPPSTPVMPSLTQVIWPTRHQEAAAPLNHSPVPAIPSPLVAYNSMQGSSARDVAMDPDLERATLEELNAALAHAFSQVSNSRSTTSSAQAFS